MKYLIIMRGCAGCGKSSEARRLLTDATAGGANNSIILSTDDYFVDTNGEYWYNKDLIGAAHDWNFSNFKRAVNMNYDVIIIDNTNTQLKEFIHYVELGFSRGYSLRIVEPSTDWKYDVDECFRRNKHGVPKETIQRMLDRFTPTDKVLSQIHEHFNPALSINYGDKTIHVSSGLSS